MSDVQKFRDRAAEIALIIECSRSSLNATQKALISNLLGGELDWDYVFMLSNRNAVTPLVARTLLDGVADTLPNTVSVRLAEGYRENLDRNMFLTGRLLSIIRHFKANDVPVLPFKGPVLAVTAYGDISCRSYVDLDVLVEPKKLDAALALLVDLSYAPISSQKIPGRFNIFSGQKKDIYLRSGDGMVNLELHWKLSGSHFSFPFVAKELWSGLQTVEIAGQSVETLAFDDLLIYLCLHGSRHGWEKFGWVCDVHELIGSVEEVDWSSVIHKARKLRCERTLYLGLHLVDHFFHVDFTFPAWKTIRDDASLSAYTKLIRTQLFEESGDVMGKRDRYLYHLALRENRRDRYRLHFHYAISYIQELLSPTEADFQSVRLPHVLAPLYYITRPIRLISRLVLGRESDSK